MNRIKDASINLSMFVLLLSTNTLCNTACEHAEDSSDTDSESDTETDTEVASRFISQWTTDGPGFTQNDQIALPLVSNGEYDFTVDWGDGSEHHISSFHSGTKKHTYATPGIYRLEIVGLLKGWAFSGSGDAGKIIEVEQWGNLGLGATNGQFQGCESLVISAKDTPDLSGTTSLSRAFQDCFMITTIPGIDQWDISNIADMSWMFAGT